MAHENPTVSLVLGSGGARGLAHIGVIRWLEENGYQIRSISGASMGALIGGIYACGKLDTFTEWVRAIDKLDIVRLLSDAALSPIDRVDMPANNLALIARNPPS